jgi:hypothetical protein
VIRTIIIKLGADLSFVNVILFKVNTLAVSQTIQYMLITLAQVHLMQLETSTSSVAHNLLPLGGKQLVTETVAENPPFILEQKLVEFPHYAGHFIHGNCTAPNCSPI